MINAKQTIDFSKAKPFRTQQNGLVLIVTLLALMILLLASVALIRSTDTNLQIAGNIAFKRDVMNQAERAIPAIQTIFTTGALSGNTARYTNSAANNYYATIQESNASGIPKRLFNITSNKIAGQDGVDIFYVIDRMCLAEGKVAEGKCIFGGTDGSEFRGKDKQTATSLPVYRITLRATGPKNAEAYLQTTFTD